MIVLTKSHAKHLLPFITWVLLLVILILAQSCGSADKINLEGQINFAPESTGEGAQITTEDIIPIEFNSDGRATLQFDDYQESSRYIATIYTYHSKGETQSFQMGHTQLMDPPALMRQLEAGTSSTTQDFHQWLRQSEEHLEPDFALQEKETPSTLIKQASIGDERSFKVLQNVSSSTGYTEVNAQIIYQTSHFNVYLDKRNLDKVNLSDLQDIFSSFDNVIDDERNLFGHESDIDHDGRFNILLTQAVNEMSLYAGGLITAFFYAIDLFDNSVYPQSNETEIIYASIPDPAGEFGSPISSAFMFSNILPSVLPHEFQHMINYNQHQSGELESAFLNEGLSHLAEDIYSIDESGYMTTTGVENPSRIAGYLQSTESLCITCGASLYQRGGSYLFLRYLYEQAEKGYLDASTNGHEFISQLLKSGKTGVENIVNASFGENVQITPSFQELIGRFGLALLFDDTQATTDSRLSIDSINIRATQLDNRGTSLHGPSVEHLNSAYLQQALSGASISFIEITSNDIDELEGSLAIQLGAGVQAGGYLIQSAP